MNSSANSDDFHITRDIQTMLNKRTSPNELKNLLMSGYDINLPIGNVGKPLHLVRNNSVNLLQKYSHPEVRIELHNQLFKAVALAQDIELINELILNGVDVNCQNPRGDTPLHITPSEEVARILLQNGASLMIKNNYGFTPLIHSLVAKKDIDVIKVLLKYGAGCENHDICIHISVVDYAEWSNIVDLMVWYGATFSQTIHTRIGVLIKQYVDLILGEVTTCPQAVHPSCTNPISMQYREYPKYDFRIPQLINTLVKYAVLFDRDEKIKDHMHTVALTLQCFFLPIIYNTTRTLDMCKVEVEKMKRCIILKSKMSLHDLCVRRYYNSRSIYFNPCVREFIFGDNTDWLRNVFPIYEYILRMNIQVARNKYNMFKLLPKLSFSSKSDDNHVSKEVKLHVDIMAHITHYLRYRDLVNIFEASMLTKTIN